MVIYVCVRHDVSDREHPTAPPLQAEHRQQATILTER